MLDQRDNKVIVFLFAVNAFAEGNDRIIIKCPDNSLYSISWRRGSQLVLLRRAAQMLLEPPHHCGIGALETGALEPVPRAFNANERRGHARLRQRRVHRLPLEHRDDCVGIAVHDERRSSPGRDEANR